MIICPLSLSTFNCTSELCCASDIVPGVKLDPSVYFVPGDGDAPEGHRWAAWPLQSDHVVSRPAAALHQRQARSGSTQSQITEGGKWKKRKKKKQWKKTMHSRCADVEAPSSERLPSMPQLGLLCLQKSVCRAATATCWNCNGTRLLGLNTRVTPKLWFCCAGLREMMKRDGFKFNLGCFLAWKCGHFTF